MIDALTIADGRDAVMMSLATANFAAMIGRYGVERSALADAPFSMHAEAVAHRSLANTLLALLNVAGSEAGQMLALNAWTDADNLTDVMAAMAALRDQHCASRDTMFSAFHDRWLNDLSMLNRWFQMEACANRSAGEALARVRELLTHPKFDGKNPNRARAVVHAFGDQNWRGFHAADGAGYAFVAEQILRYDAQNPSLAARFCDPFLRWHKCAEPQRGLQKVQLERLVAHAVLSPNVSELIEKTLKAGNPAA